MGGDGLNWAFFLDEISEIVVEQPPDSKYVIFFKKCDDR